MANKTVLIVDDDLSLYDNLRDILQDEGYEPFSSGTIAEGLKLARERRPEMVLLDLKLPDGQGTTLLTDLKRENPDCICIIMTAYADLDSAVVAVEKGAYHYLQKPIRPAELLRLLGGAFETIQLREQKRQAEEALRRNEELLRDFLDNASDLIQVVDPSARFLYVNRKWLEVLGYTTDEAFKLSLSDTIHPDSFDHCYNIFQRLLAGETLDRLEAIFVTKDGKEICVEGSVSCRFENEKPVNTRGIFRDITEQKQMEVQLRQAQKMEAIGTLAGGIAHDFNNILSAIMGYTEMAQYDVSEESRVRPKLDQVLNASHRAEDLVKQILAFSRESEKERKPIQVHLIVKEALKLLRASLPSTIEISQDVSTGLDTILGDPTQIHQVLMNLCTNAHHAMGEKGGVLGVTLAPVDLDAEGTTPYPDLHPGAYLKLTVSDTGHGMEQSTMERIFDPYFTTKEKEVGTGLGLAVVHGIVKSHGGAIKVSSNPAEGTSFHILFPRLDMRVVEKAGPIQALPTGAERVLFIDDEKALVEIGKQMLGRLGYECVCRTSSIETLEAFRAQPHRFDLVITDQTMPGLTGAGLAKELMRIRPDIPIILCTGYSELISEDKAMAIGIREFIMKPILIHDLAIAIRKVLDK